MPKTKLNKPPQEVVKLVKDAIDAYDLEFGPTFRRYTYPNLSVWRTTDRFSNGRAYIDDARGLSLTLGTERLDRKHVILHEVAHWLTPKDSHHDHEFYATAWWLWRRFRVNPEYALYREAWYRRQSLKTAKALGVPRAHAVAREIKACKNAGWVAFMKYMDRRQAMRERGWV